MKRKATTTLIAAMVSLLGLTGCFEIAEADTVTVERQMSYSGITSIDLETVNGRVEIEAGDGENVMVLVRLDLPEGLDADTVLEISDNDGVLKLREDWPKRFFFRDSSNATYTLSVPRDVTLNVGSTNGRLSSNGVSGPQHLESVNGRIWISTPSSHVIAKTVNGRIETVFTERFQGARLGTINGSVRVRVPEGTEMVADVSQVNGSFNSEIPMVVGSKRGSAPVLDVSTVNGSIKVDRNE